MLIIIFRFLTTASHDVKKFFINSDFNKSQYTSIFLNQLLSYAMVKKYGGYALNFDTLLIKSVLGLNSNFLTKCSEDSIEDQPYFLHHKHPLIDDVISQLSKGFRMNVSQSIGRNLITKIIKEECNVSNLDIIFDILFFIIALTFYCFRSITLSN